MIGCIYEVWRSARKDRERRARNSEEEEVAVAPNPQRWQGPPYNETAVVASSAVKTVGFKPLDEEEKKLNGTHAKSSTKDYKTVPILEPKSDLLLEKKIHIKGDRFYHV